MLLRNQQSQQRKLSMMYASQCENVVDGVAKCLTSVESAMAVLQRRYVLLTCPPLSPFGQLHAGGGGNAREEASIGGACVCSCVSCVCACVSSLMIPCAHRHPTIRVAAI